MSSLPTNILGSIAQTAIQQEQLARAGDTAMSRRAEQSRLMAERSEQAQNAVEDTDGESDVHDGGGGAGGQGRAFSNPDQENSDNTGLTTDQDGRTHLDIEA